MTAAQTTITAADARNAVTVPRRDISKSYPAVGQAFVLNFGPCAGVDLLEILSYKCDGFLRLKLSPGVQLREMSLSGGRYVVAFAERLGAGDRG